MLMDIPFPHRSFQLLPFFADSRILKLIDLLHTVSISLKPLLSKDYSKSSAGLFLFAHHEDSRRFDVFFLEMSKCWNQLPFEII
jgi:hypothetical protein